MEINIKEEILYCEKKAREYTKDAELNTGGKAEYWKGKADAHEYIAIRLKRVIEWHNSTGMC